MVLKGSLLCYYVNPYDTTPKGTLEITENTNILFGDEQQVRKKNCFVVVTEKREYNMYTDDDQVFSWVYHLRASVYYKHLHVVFSSVPGRFPIKPQAPPEKRGHFKRHGKLSKKCFLVLKPDSLSIYDKENDSKAQKVFTMKSITVDCDDNGVIISCSGKRTLLVGDKKEQSEWYQAILDACKNQCDYYRIEFNSRGLHAYILDMIRGGKQTPKLHSPYDWQRISFVMPNQAK
jgi:hypothetical protein